MVIHLRDVNHVSRLSNFSLCINIFLLYLLIANATEIEVESNPCKISPCGSNSNCKVIRSIAVCACAQYYLGSPPNCRAECDTDAECVSNKACIHYKCIDPCLEVCGHNAVCKTFDHLPNCSCPDGYIGDPFVECIEG